MSTRTAHCIICGSGEAKFCGSRIHPDAKKTHDIDVLQCVKCGLLFPYPMPELTYSELQSNFNDPLEYFREKPEERMDLFRNVLADLGKCGTKTGALLDVGCGRGELLSVAKKEGWDAWGTEISESFVNYAVKHFKVNARVGDIISMNLPSERFDAVTLVSVIQYLQKPLAALKEIHRVLKKDGVLYIECTNDGSPVFFIGGILASIKARRKVSVNLSPVFTSYQTFGFNRKSLTRALELAGFEIEYFTLRGAQTKSGVKRYGILNKPLNFVYKCVLLLSAICGQGHLMFCIARKRG